MPENNSKYQARLVNLRNQIKKHGLNGFLLPRTDEYQNEFLAPYSERLEWLTGFTGSAGSAVILSDKAIVLSDSRYTIQLRNQINHSIYSTENIADTSVGKCLSIYADNGTKIGYDAWLYTSKQLDDIRNDAADKNIEFIPMDFNLIDEIWEDQPKKPKAPVTVFPDAVAGCSSEDKRLDIAKKITEANCGACVLTLCDSICWLLNVRGGDIDYSPLVLSYAILYADGSLDWFVEEDKVSDEVLDHIGSGVNIYSFDKIPDRVGNINNAVWLDRGSCPIWFENHVVKDIKDLKDPCITQKSIKSMAEQEAIRLTHIYDGVALVKFLKWLDETDEDMSELSVEAKLEGFRRENAAYLAPSFATIAGFSGNGAIVHYRATSDSNKDIKGNGLLLIDSGGQYRWGTTDVTRTIAIGNPSDEMIENYTRVLKGHIAVASAHFKKGTIGKEIDILARKSLQEVGLDYGHGTGHGVGCYLCVHEAAAYISPRAEVAFEEGMLISNEPGYYKDGEYGIRIEGLVLVENSGDNLCFDTVTLAPFDCKLIDMSMIDKDERAWLQSYAKDIIEKLSQYLSEEENIWLRNSVSIFSI